MSGLHSRLRVDADSRARGASLLTGMLPLFQNRAANSVQAVIPNIPFCGRSQHMANSSLKATEEAPMGDARAHDGMHIAEIVLAGGGEMGALMRAQDWSQTSLGPIEDWPQSLRTAISICLDSRFPILIWWGSEL